MYSHLARHGFIGTNLSQTGIDGTSHSNTSPTLISEHERQRLQVEWIKKLHRQQMLANKASPMPFKRRKLFHSTFIYESEDNKASKIALVCFTGNEQRMMMPTPTFLQHIDSNRADVIFLQTRKGQGYRNGILGFGDDLENGLVKLEELLGSMGHGSVATMGVSAGGVATILAGLKIGANVVLSVGSTNPDDVRWHPHSDGHGAKKLFEKYCHGTNRRPDIYLMHGELSQEDAAANTVISNSIQTKHTFEIKKSNHVVLNHILQQGTLAMLLNNTVLSAHTEQV